MTSTKVLKWTLAFALALSPRLASAQCRDDSSVRYPNGRYPYDEDAARGSYRDIDGTVRYLLSEEPSRAALAEAILAEPQFLAEVVDAITELPEWRALAREILGSSAATMPMDERSMSARAPVPGGRGAPRPPRRVQRAIDRALSDQDLSEGLLDAILEDAEFTRHFLARVAEVPEARAVAAERLARERTTSESLSRDTSRRPPTPPSSKQDAALYACPMHPEVTSGRSGTCPKCGMGLRRVR